MSALGDDLRAQAALLETSAMSPWTASLQDDAWNSAQKMRATAAKVDDALLLNIPLLGSVLAGILSP